MNKKLGAWVLAFGLVQMSGQAVAAPMQSWLTPLNKMCFINNGTVYPGVAAPGEKKIIYGPYTAKCATTYHKFQLGLLFVDVEQLIGGAWKVVDGGAFNPAKQYGSGTFRIVLNNYGKQTPAPYRGGTFSVPL